MQPEPSVLQGIEIEGIDIEKMLTVLNQRIRVLCDREHTIGHAYFMSLKKYDWCLGITENRRQSNS